MLALRKWDPHPNIGQKRLVLLGRHPSILSLSITVRVAVFSVFVRDGGTRLVAQSVIWQHPLTAGAPIWKVYQLSAEAML